MPEPPRSRPPTGAVTSVSTATGAAVRVVAREPGVIESGGAPGGLQDHGPSREPDGDADPCDCGDRDQEWGPVREGRPVDAARSGGGGPWFLRGDGPETRSRGRPLMAAFPDAERLSHGIRPNVF